MQTPCGPPNKTHMDAGAQCLCALKRAGGRGVEAQALCLLPPPPQLVVVELLLLLRLLLLRLLPLRLLLLRRLARRRLGIRGIGVRCGLGRRRRRARLALVAEPVEVLAGGCGGAAGRGRPVTRSSTGGAQPAISRSAAQRARRRPAPPAQEPTFCRRSSAADTSSTRNAGSSCAARLPCSACLPSSQAVNSSTLASRALTSSSPSHGLTSGQVLTALRVSSTKSAASLMICARVCVFVCVRSQAGEGAPGRGTTHPQGRAAGRSAARAQAPAAAAAAGQPHPPTCGRFLASSTRAKILSPTSRTLRSWALQGEQTARDGMYV